MPLIENCCAHFPSTRNNQIDAATNRSKQVHRQTKFGLVGPQDVYVEVIRTMISNRIYYIFFFMHIIIYSIVFSGQDVLLPFEQFSCVLLVSLGSLRAFYALNLHSTRGYCTKQIYADNLHNKCRDLSDWVGCKIAWFVQTQSWRNLIKPRFLCYADFSRMNVLIYVLFIGNILGIGISSSLKMYFYFHQNKPLFPEWPPRWRRWRRGGGLGGGVRLPQVLTGAKTIIRWVPSQVPRSTCFFQKWVREPG